MVSSVDGLGATKPHFVRTLADPASNIKENTIMSSSQASLLPHATRELARFAAALARLVGPRHMGGAQAAFRCTEEIVGVGRDHHAG